jgi:histo-blood group ABO system transferase
MKIAFVTIATNKYIKFAENLLDSIGKYGFLNTNIKTDLFVFSNIPQIFQLKNGRTKVKGIITTHVPFPLISLLRYHYYSSCNELEDYDYIFHIDCDMELKDNLGEDILGERVCVLHPGFAGIKDNMSYPYDRNQLSNAYVELGGGNQYYQNCFQGGSSKEFLNMCKILKERCEDDLRKNYIALWHDESYMNRYMIENPPTLVLPPTYAQPQNWPLYGPTKIMHLDKDHLEMRKTT